MNQVNDDEIDMFDLFQTLWDGKWKVITTTFFAALVGVVFSYFQPNSYQVTTHIESGKKSVFYKHANLNILLKSENLLFDETNNPNGYSFDSDSVFKMFVSDFNDYKEMINVLSKNDYVKQTIKDLEESDKKRALINMAKLFEINPPSKKEENWSLSFKWHDYSDGLQMFNDAIQQTLLNLKKSIKDNVEYLALSVDKNNSNKLLNLYTQLDSIKQDSINFKKKRIQYLTEQLSIAKDLGIETNTLDPQTPGITLSIVNDDSDASDVANNSISNLESERERIPYYLRGYKILEKEISIIKKRSNEDNLLKTRGYLHVQAKIFNLKNNLSSYHLRAASDLITADNPYNWVQYDLELSDIKSQKKPWLYFTLFMALGGGILGIMYVLISSVFRKRKEYLTKV